MTYLWEQVWERTSWLEIVGRYVIARKNKKKQIESFIFPRYHQLDVTRKLQAAVLAEGPGQKYLIQHGAGSGKTNSIAWAAHFLADLHAPKVAGTFQVPSADTLNIDEVNGNGTRSVPATMKIFDSVLVVSDRNVIDGQLLASTKLIGTTTLENAAPKAAEQRASRLQPELQTG